MRHRAAGRARNRCGARSCSDRRGGGVVDPDHVPFLLPAGQRDKAGFADGGAAQGAGEWARPADAAEGGMVISEDVFRQDRTKLVERSESRDVMPVDIGKMAFEKIIAKRTTNIRPHGHDTSGIDAGSMIKNSG